MVSLAHRLMGQENLRQYAVVAILWGWLALLLATHYGARSPYSYGWAMFGQQSGRVAGAVVNPDASFSYFTTYYFYDGVLRTPPLTQNLRLPMHSFSASVVMSYLRSYLAANYLLNVAFLALLAFAAVNLASRAGMAWTPATIALLTIASLPMFVTYIGQPLHYTVGTATNFLIVLALFAMRDDDIRNPWITGLATAVLTLSYDPYVFLAAVVLYVCWYVRFRTPRDYAIYFAIAVIPRVVWQWFVDRIVDENIGAAVREAVFIPLMRGWLTVLRNPIENALVPFVASHVGMRVAAQQILAMIYWPVLIVALWGLYRFRSSEPSMRSRLVTLVACFFVIEQLVAAAFDWENNPRRAIPFVLAVAFALCVTAMRGWTSKPWRITVIGVFVISALLSFADTLLKNPAITYLGTAQAMSRAPKEPLAYQNLRLNPESMPALMSDETIQWHDVSKAERMTPSRLPQFAFTQIFNTAALAALFWLLGRADLIARRSWIVVAMVCAGSLFVRFI